MTFKKTAVRAKLTAVFFCSSITCLFFGNDVVWTNSSSHLHSLKTLTALAAESRFRPISSIHGLDFKDVATEAYITKKIKDMPEKLSKPRVVPVGEEPFPALLDKGLTLIAVHTGHQEDLAGDTDQMVLYPAKKMLKEVEFDYIYEHFSGLYPSYLSEHHEGVLVDNDHAPGKYYIPNLHGDHFVIIGGGFEYCHYVAFLRLIEQIKMGLQDRRNGHPIVIDIPVFALYQNGHASENGEKYLVSDSVGIEANFEYYIKTLVASSLPYEALKVCKDGQVLLRDSSEKPSVILRIIGDFETFMAVLPESERVYTTNLRDMLTYIQAKPQTQPLIVALGTGWIKGYDKDRGLQYNALNPLIVSLRTYCESKGISFIVGEDNRLLGLINNEKAKDVHANAKVVVLADENIVRSEEFASLRNDEKNAVVVGVNNQELTANNYIRLMEMLTLALRLSAGLEISLDNAHITITKDSELHLYIFLPHAEPMDDDRLRIIYKVQRFA